MKCMKGVGATDLVSAAKIISRLSRVAYGSHLHKRLSRLHNKALFHGEYDRLEMALNNIKKSKFVPLLSKNAHTAKKWAIKNKIYNNGHKRLQTWSDLMKQYAQMQIGQKNIVLSDN